MRGMSELRAARWIDKMVRRGLGVETCAGLLRRSDGSRGRILGLECSDL